MKHKTANTRSEFKAYDELDEISIGQNLFQIEIGDGQ